MGFGAWVGMGRLALFMIVVVVWPSGFYELREKIPGGVEMGL